MKQSGYFVIDYLQIRDFWLLHPIEFTFVFVKI
jgi:hypothetical protein